jgi:hypothetical protein
MHAKHDIYTYIRIVGGSMQIWLRRNSIVFGGGMTVPATIVQIAKEQVEAWCKANKRKPRKDVPLKQPLIVMWSKPPLGSIMLNLGRIDR